MKKVYIVRHCRAMGQSPEAELTAEGHLQANKLATFLIDREIDSITSSPFVRAIQSITPLSQALKQEIKTDDRLAERILTSQNLPNWMDHLRISFEELDRRLTGGETSREAMNRILSILNELLTTHFKNYVIVTHGNLLSLLLKNYDDRYGFEEWQRLSNPDVYCLSVKDDSSLLERIWV